MYCSNCRKEFEFPTYIGYKLWNWDENLRWSGGEWSEESARDPANWKRPGDWRGDAWGSDYPVYYAACPFCLEPLYLGKIELYHCNDGTITMEEPESRIEFFKENKDDKTLRLGEKDEDPKLQRILKLTKVEGEE